MQGKEGRGGGGGKDATFAILLSLFCLPKCSSFSPPPFFFFFFGRIRRHPSSFSVRERKRKGRGGRGKEGPTNVGVARGKLTLGGDTSGS